MRCLIASSRRFRRFTQTESKEHISLPFIGNWHAGHMASRNDHDRTKGAVWLDVGIARAGEVYHAGARDQAREVRSALIKR